MFQKCVALPKDKELMFRNLTLNRAIMVSGAWCGGEERMSTVIFWARPGDPESQCKKTPEGRDWAFTQAQFISILISIPKGEWSGRAL